MKRPFSYVHTIQSLDSLIIHWCGEDKAGLTLIIELINSYRELMNKPKT